MHQTCRYCVLLSLALATPGLTQPPVTTLLNPQVTRIVEGVSEERIAATMKKLESFGTRYVLSEQDNPRHGIGAARQWIFNELRSYSPRLQVSLDPFHLKKGPRVAQDVDDEAFEAIDGNYLHVGL